MADDIRTLRDLAQRASDRHGGKRGRALDREAKKHGLTLSYTTTDKILNGKYNSVPKRETLEALAYLAGVPASVAYEVAGAPMPTAPFAEQLPPDVDTLNSEQRRALIDLARVFVKQNKHIHELEAHHDHEDEQEPRTQTGSTVDGSEDRREDGSTPGQPGASMKNRYGLAADDDQSADRAPSEGVRQWEHADTLGEGSQDPGDHHAS